MELNWEIIDFIMSFEYKVWATQQIYYISIYLSFYQELLLITSNIEKSYEIID